MPVIAYYACDCCGGGGVSTACCAEPVPETLSVTVTGTCSGSGTIVWDSGSGLWSGDIAMPSGTLHVTLLCQGTSWKVVVTNCANEAFLPSAQCEPFLISVSVADGSGCCGTGGGLTVTITE